MKPYLVIEDINLNLDDDWSLHVVNDPFKKIVNDPLVEANEKVFGIEMPYYNNTIGHKLFRSFHDSQCELFTIQTIYLIREMLVKGSHGIYH
jgi:hypothetical protein